MSHAIKQSIYRQLHKLIMQNVFSESVLDVFDMHNQNPNIIILHQLLLKWLEQQNITTQPFKYRPLYIHQFNYLLELTRTIGNSQELELKKNKWVESCASIKAANIFLHEILYCEDATIIYKQMNSYLQITQTFYSQYKNIDAIQMLNWICTQQQLIAIIERDHLLKPLPLQVEQGIWRKNYHLFIQSLFIN